MDQTTSAHTTQPKVVPAPVTQPVNIATEPIPVKQETDLPNAMFPAQSTPHPMPAIQPNPVQPETQPRAKTPSNPKPKRSLEGRLAISLAVIIFIILAFFATKAFKT